MNAIFLNKPVAFDDSIEDKEQRKQLMLAALIKLFNHTMYAK